jgi:hypothetical protein
MRNKDFPHDLDSLVLRRLAPINDHQLQYTISPLYSAKGKSKKSKSKASEVNETQDWGELKTPTIRNGLLRFLQLPSPPGLGRAMPSLLERVAVSEAHRVITSEASFETQCLWTTLMLPVNDVLCLLGKDISIHSHHPIKKTREGDFKRTPDWLVLRGTAEELKEARAGKMNEGRPTIRNHILLVGETKVHDSETETREPSVRNTLACRLDNVGQVQEYADIAKVRFGFLVTNLELVLLHFCADGEEHAHSDMIASSPAVLASPDRLALQETTPTGTPRGRGSVREQTVGHVVAAIPQSSPITATRAAEQMADVERDRREMSRARGFIRGRRSRAAATPDPEPASSPASVTHTTSTVQDSISGNDTEDETYNDHDTEATLAFQPPYISSIAYEGSSSGDVPSPAAALLHLILMADRCKDDGTLKPQLTPVSLS